jgi:hypothetical protein
MPGPGLTSSPASPVAAAALCPTCGGVGRLICPACGGAGTYFIIGYGGYMELWPCNVCQMTGSIMCYTCMGTGLAPSAPYLVMNPTSMWFSATAGGGNPSSQALTVRRSDYGAWWTQITAPDTWAQVSFNPSNTTFYVSPQTSGLAPGTYTTNVLVQMWSNGVNGTPVQGSPLHVPVTFVVNPVGTVAAPTFSPNGGTFSSPQLVTISCATAGATIRYTTNGSDPTVSSAIYSGPVNVPGSWTLKARAFKTNWTGSGVAQAVFTNTTNADTNNTPAAITLSTETKLSGPSSVKVKRTLKLTGTVVPSAASGTVTIVKQRLVGKKWKSAGSARVNVSSGSYGYSFKPTKKGKWRFVAKYSGDVIGTTTYTASNSSTKGVRVR